MNYYKNNLMKLGKLKKQNKMEKYYKLTLGSEYNNFVEKATTTNDLGLIDYLDSLELTRDEMQFAYITYVNFNITVADAIASTLELKKFINNIKVK
jgi:hypothetical protein